ncbi:hypothetical protein ALC60_06344, partial [Trachymyrmex zeteki]
FETNESDFIDASPQSPNFPTNSLIYSKSDMLSRNSDSELTTNVGSDRQHNFESAYEALQRAGLINSDWLLYLILAYASRVFIRERRERTCVDWVSRRLENMGVCCITTGAKRVNYIIRSTKLRQMPPGGTDHRLSLLAKSTLQERLLEALLDVVCPSSRTSALLSPDFPNKADPTFLEDIKVPLALNHIANILLVKCEEMTRHVESGVKGYGYAAIQTDRRIKDTVEIAEGDAALRLVVDEEA